jgi:hypothetical protein
MSDPAPSPFEPLPGESSRAFAAFVAFRDLGSGRSVVAAYRQKTGKEQAKQASGEWNSWASRFDWQIRATAYDAHQEAVRRRAIDAELAREAAKWERRRQEALERGWENAQKLYQQAETMLTWPLSTQRTSKDGMKVVIRPARWSKETMFKVLRAAVELEAAVLTAVSKDPANMSDAELAGVLGRHDEEAARPTTGRQERSSAEG